MDGSVGYVWAGGILLKKRITGKPIRNPGRGSPSLGFVGVKGGEHLSVGHRGGGGEGP